MPWKTALLHKFKTRELHWRVTKEEKIWRENIFTNVRIRNI